MNRISHHISHKQQLRTENKEDRCFNDNENISRLESDVKVDADAVSVNTRILNHFPNELCNVELETFISTKANSLAQNIHMKIIEFEPFSLALCSRYLNNTSLSFPLHLLECCSGRQ